ncbi:MAG: peptidoglycan recognition family protein [Eubacteriales bacterium]|nr:peptidoglycan recognition family protein [Eubacteriales bacterium]
MEKKQKPKKYLWRRRRKRKRISIGIAAAAVILCLSGIGLGSYMGKQAAEAKAQAAEASEERIVPASGASSSSDSTGAEPAWEYDERGPEFWKGAPPIDAQLLTPNEYSRSQLPLTSINYIVIHYTANPGSTAQDNRDYFENLKEGIDDVHASSHFVIGMEGEIIQCIPSTEMSYASNDRNIDSIAIECCHPDDSGRYTEKTYASVVQLTAWMCKAFGVSPENVIRHYDITGKICPKYYVENEGEWTKMLADIRSEYEKLQRDAEN